tara:strand:+ start:113 stop:613 length:501 start_codon:yes stop_codon:yes gene_type:complete
MKKIFLLITFLSSLAIFAQEENEMTPLREWLIDNDGDVNNSSVLYFSYRCAALYGMMYGLISDAPQEDAPEIAKGLQDAQLSYIVFAERAYNELTPENERDFTDNLTRSAVPMADNYQKEANKSWVNSGEYFNDFIQDDAFVCKEFIGSINKITSNSHHSLNQSQE